MSPLSMQDVRYLRKSRIARGIIAFRDRREQRNKKNFRTDRRTYTNDETGNLPDMHFVPLDDIWLSSDLPDDLAFRGK